MKVFLIGYPAAVFLAALSVIAAQFDYSDADWPAWVQAVGSILAILAAGGAALYQSRATERHAERVRLQAKADKVAAITAIATKAYDLIIALDKAFVERRSREYFDNAYSAVTFDHVAKALAAIPLHELGSYQLVEGIIKLTEGMSFVSIFCEQSERQDVVHLYEQEKYNLSLQGVAALARGGLELVFIANQESRADLDLM